MIKGLVPQVQEEFAAFMVENMKKHGLTKEQAVINFEIAEQNPLKDHECRLGGFWVYAHYGQIVFKNTVESRLELCFEMSIPDIKAGLFPNMKVLDAKQD